MGAVEPIKKDMVTSNNLVSFRDKRNKIKGKEVKMKLDGTPKQTHSNSMSGTPHEVYPIKKQQDLQAMINYFINKKNATTSIKEKKIAMRDLMMFIIGINTALRAGDLLKLTWDNVFDSNGEFRDYTRLKEQKTSKFKNLSYNSACKNVITKYIQEFSPLIQPELHLFASRQGGTIEVKTACATLKEAATSCGFQFNVGSHTMRKTFGYWFIQNNKNDMTALAKLQELLNHSSQKTTLRYIGLADEETKKCYDSNVLGMF